MLKKRSAPRWRNVRLFLNNQLQFSNLFGSPELSDTTFPIPGMEQDVLEDGGWELQRDYQTSTLPRVGFYWSSSLLHWRMCLQTKSCELLVEISRCLRWTSKTQKELES